MKSLIRILALGACAVTQISASAQTWSKTSPEHTVALLELYTSEGCISCPPADNYVSGLYKVSGLTADQVVPLSLHVDYWDYIGWKDVYAKPLFTERQRWLSELASSRTVYTPEVFVAGKEFRSWPGGMVAAVKRINQQPALAQIMLNVAKLPDNKLNVSLTGNSKQAGKLYFALVENGLVSNVKAGENQGVSLHHDYVARVWGDPIPLNGLAASSVIRQITVPPNAVGKNLSLTAFVQSERGDILQALSLPLTQ